MDVATALLPTQEPVPHALPATTSMPPPKHVSTALHHALAARLPLSVSPAKTVLLFLVTSAIRPLFSPAVLNQRASVHPVMMVSLTLTQPAFHQSPLGATLPVPVSTAPQGNTSVLESA